MDLRLRHEGEILGYRQHGGVTLRFVDLDADEELIEWAHLDAIELLRYACTLDSVATRPCAMRSPCDIDTFLRRSAEDENHRRRMARS